MSTNLVDGRIGAVVRRVAIGGLSIVLGSVIWVAQSAPAYALGTCTAAARGISSFSCPGTPTEDVCGNAPNYSCYAASAEPTCGADQHFDCGSCACACNSGFVNCSGVCRPILICPAGLTPDHCAGTCTTPYVMLKSATPPGGVFPQAGGIQVTGDMSTAGDIYLSTGKALRIDGVGDTSLNMSNYGGGAFTLNVGGTIQGSQFCIGGSCISAWPGGGGGGGTVTSVTGGSGLTSTPSPITGAGTLNVGAGTGISVAADTVGLDLTYVDGRFVNVGGDTMTGGLSAPTVTGSSQLCIGADCRASWPSGGGGVTSITQGAGLSFSSNPITDTGTIALDFAGSLDPRFVNIGGDTMTGKLTVPSFEVTSSNAVFDVNARVVGSAGFGGYSPDVSWPVSTPGAYIGSSGASTFIGAGDVTTDNRVTGSELCIGSDCRAAWPTGGGAETDTLQTVTDRGSVTTRSVSIQNVLSVTGAGGTSANFIGGNVQVVGGYLSSSAGLIAYSGQGICATTGASAASCTGASAPSPGYVKAVGYCLPGTNPTGGCITTWPTSGTGDITEVGAGNGLTGGGTVGAVALDVQASNGIVVSSDSVQLDPNYLTGPYVRKAGDTMTGSLTISAGNNLSVGGGLNIGSGSGATAGEIQAGGRFITTNSTGANANPGFRFGPSGYPTVFYDTVAGSNYLRPDVGVSVPKLTVSPGGPIAVPAAAGADSFFTGKAYFQITGPTGTGNRVEIGNASGGSYGLYVYNNPGAKIQNSNTITSVELAPASYGLSARSTAPANYAGYFTNDSGTTVSIGGSNYGVYAANANTYAGWFTNRNSAAQVLLAGANGTYGVYAVAPSGGYALYGTGNSYFNGNATVTGNLNVNGSTSLYGTTIAPGATLSLNGVVKGQWPIWQGVQSLPPSGTFCSPGIYYNRTFTCPSGTTLISYTCRIDSTPVGACPTTLSSTTGITVPVLCGRTATVNLLCQ